MVAEVYGLARRPVAHMDRVSLVKRITYPVSCGDSEPIKLGSFDTKEVSLKGERTSRVVEPFLDIFLFLSRRY